MYLASSLWWNGLTSRQRRLDFPRQPAKGSRSVAQRIKNKTLIAESGRFQDPAKVPVCKISIVERITDPICKNDIVGSIGFSKFVLKKLGWKEPVGLVAETAVSKAGPYITVVVSVLAIRDLAQVGLVIENECKSHI